VIAGDTAYTVVTFAPAMRRRLPAIMIDGGFLESETTFPAHCRVVRCLPQTRMWTVGCWANRRRLRR